MSDAVLLDEVLTLALKLPPRQRLRLIEQIASSIEREIEPPPTEEHWGKALNRLLDSLDMSDWEALDIDDPVEWVKKLRAEQLEKRLGDWGTEA